VIDQNVELVNDAQVYILLLLEPVSPIWDLGWADRRSNQKGIER
jgi:hypothetical protein